MITIKAKPVTSGVVSGEAIVSKMAISFTGGLDPDSGVIKEPGHDLKGKKVAGKILVFPTGKGSTTGPWQYYAAFKRGNAPNGIVNMVAEGVIAVCAIITNTPMVHLPERNILEIIEDGDIVTIDADLGYIKIKKTIKS